MAEALIIPMIQKLEVDGDRDALAEITSDLRLILDIMRDNKLGEERKVRYLIDDLVDIIGSLLQQWIRNIDGIRLAERWTGEVKKRLFAMGGDGAEKRSESAEEEEDRDVVVLGEDVKDLLRVFILNEQQGLELCVVAGMVGTGKTTLARQIYNHAAVVDQFEYRAWVRVSTELSHKEVLMKLIQQVVDNDELERGSLMEQMDRADNASLQQMLHQHLEGTRYLIVLDDFPKEMLIKAIIKALPQEGKESRLLLTSRFLKFESPVGGIQYKMEPLDSDESWRFFLGVLNYGNKLSSVDEFPKHLEKKAKEMLRKCGGLPLAIKEVAGQLAEKRRSGSEWEQLVESIDFGSTLEKLEVFYHKLDPKLKPCFLNMAFYKENTIMREEKLRHIWVLGGVVSEYDLCESYFKDLINDSVIQVKDRSTRYLLNVVLHKLSIKKAEDEIGFEILRSNGNGRPSPNPRHRVLICSRDGFNYHASRGNKHIVSLFFHGGGYLDTSSSFWQSFEQLKILDLEDFGLKILPESIGTLTKLKYLGLRNNFIVELPLSLRCLKNLEVLDIAQNLMVEMPDIIWEMGSLGHIYMSDVIYRKPFKLDQALKNLETLTYISVDNLTSELSGLQTMTSLCKLGIEELDEMSDLSELFSSLSGLGGLQNLILRGFSFRSMPCLDELGILQHLTHLKLDGLLPRLPKNFPPFIKYLKLVNSCLDEDPMPVLEKLTRLRHLKLRNAFTGREMEIEKFYPFPSLNVLRIEELWNLRHIRLAYALVALDKLEIKNCPHLKTLPRMIDSSQYLKELNMVTSKKVETKIRKSFLFSLISGRVRVSF